MICHCAALCSSRLRYRVKHIHIHILTIKVTSLLRSHQLSPTSDMISEVLFYTGWHLGSID